MFDVKRKLLKKIANNSNNTTNYFNRFDNEVYKLDYILKEIIQNEIKITDEILYNENKNLYTTRGILIPFMVMIEDDKTIGVYENITILCYFNNIYYKMGDFHNDIENKIIIEDWISTKNDHWKDIHFDFLEDLYFMMYKKIYNEKDPVDLMSSCSFRVRNWPIKYVNISYTFKNKISKIVDLNYIYDNITV